VRKENELYFENFLFFSRVPILQLYSTGNAGKSLETTDTKRGKN